MKTTIPDIETVRKNRVWHHFDAKDKILGRLASRIAVLLMGKHKPYWTPHIDCGDFVVVTNAQKVRVTGEKLVQKQYFSHSGYPDGAKLTSLKRLLDEQPQRVIELAVKRMLPKNKLGRRMITRLNVYAGASHPHAGQRPATLN